MILLHMGQSNSVQHKFSGCQDLISGHRSSVEPILGSEGYNPLSNVMARVRCLVKWLELWLKQKGYMVKKLVST